MLNQNKFYVITYLFFILLLSKIVRAENFPELLLIEEKKTQNEAMWDNADNVFNNAPSPTINPSLPANTDQVNANNQPIKVPANPIQPIILGKSAKNSKTQEPKKIPIGRTNTFPKGDFKQKTIPEYSKFNLVGPNKNLPPVYFESNLVVDAFKAVKKNDINTLRYLIKNYDLENFVDDSGDNLLLEAASEGQINALRVLLVNKYDINFLNTNKMSALHISVANQDIKMVKTLLTMNIDASIKDINGKTALDYAKEMNSEIKDFIVSYLN